MSSAQARRAPDDPTGDRSAALGRLLSDERPAGAGHSAAAPRGRRRDVRRGHRAPLDRLAARPDRAPGADRERPRRGHGGSGRRPRGAGQVRAVRPHRAGDVLPRARRGLRRPLRLGDAPGRRRQPAHRRHGRRDPLVGTAPGAPLAVPHPRRPRPRGARRLARHARAARGGGAARTGRPVAAAAAVGSAARRAGTDAAPPGRPGAVPPSWRSRRSPARSPPASWAGSRRRPRPTCSTSSRRGP